MRKYLVIFLFLISYPLNSSGIKENDFAFDQTIHHFLNRTNFDFQKCENFFSRIILNNQDFNYFTHKYEKYFLKRIKLLTKRNPDQYKKISSLHSFFSKKKIDLATDFHSTLCIFQRIPLDIKKETIILKKSIWHHNPTPEEQWYIYDQYNCTNPLGDKLFTYTSKASALPHTSTQTRLTLINHQEQGTCDLWVKIQENFNIYFHNYDYKIPFQELVRIKPSKKIKLNQEGEVEIFLGTFPFDRIDNLSRSQSHHIYDYFDNSYQKAHEVYGCENEDKFIKKQGRLSRDEMYIQSQINQQDPDFEKLGKIILAKIKKSLLPKTPLENFSIQQGSFIYHLNQMTGLLYSQNQLNRATIWTLIGGFNPETRTLHTAKNKLCADIKLKQKPQEILDLSWPLFLKEMNRINSFINTDYPVEAFRIQSSILKALAPLVNFKDIRMLMLKGHYFHHSLDQDFSDLMFEMKRLEFLDLRENDLDHKDIEHLSTILQKYPDIPLKILNISANKKIDSSFLEKMFQDLHHETLTHIYYTDSETGEKQKMILETSEDVKNQTEVLEIFYKKYTIKIKKLLNNIQ